MYSHRMGLLLLIAETPESAALSARGLYFPVFFHYLSFVLFSDEPYETVGY